MNHGAKIENGCLLLCKDKNFKANHNPFLLLDSTQYDVCYYAKIRILKQITTCRSDDIFGLKDVCYYAKIRILKQITTCPCAIITGILMFVTMQR